MKVLAAQSCPTLGDPMDYSPPGSSVHGISPGESSGVGSHSQNHSSDLLVLKKSFVHLIFLAVYKYVRESGINLATPTPVMKNV